MAGITGLRVEAYAQYMNLEFEKVVKFDDKYGDDYKMDNNIAMSYLYMGKIWMAYSKFKAIVNNPRYPEEVKESSRYFVEVIENLISGFDLSQPDDFNRRQSIENSIEQYPELHTLDEVMKYTDQDRKLEYIREVDMLTHSPDPIERGLAFFIIAEFYVYFGQFDNAVMNYILALKCDKNKALYWGYCGQVLNTHLKYDPVQCLFFLDNAETLDPQNPRWKFLKSIALFRQGKIAIDKALNSETYFIFNAYYSQAIKHLKAAKELCRENQMRLFNEICKSENMLYEFYKMLEGNIGQ